MYNSLLQANINVRAIAQGCSEFNITVVVKREDCIKALKAVHSRFYLSRTTIAVGIIGPGLIGSTLLEQLKDQVLFFLFFRGGYIILILVIPFLTYLQCIIQCHILDMNNHCDSLYIYIFVQYHILQTLNQLTFMV